MLDIPFYATEDVPQGSMQQSTMAFAADAGNAVLNVKCKWSDLKNVIKYILGYAVVRPEITAANPNPHPPNGFRMSRLPPARHPRWPNMRATKITSIIGEALSAKYRADNGLPKSRQILGSGGFIGGDWDFAKVSILFELPSYPIMDDAELAGQPEYIRNVSRNFEASVENLAKKTNDPWSFVDSDARGISPIYHGDRTLRQPKGTLSWTWHDVPEDWLFCGKLFPTNLYASVGTVNSLPFPFICYRDQNRADDKAVNFQAGTLLFMPPKLKPRVQMHPSVLGTILPGDYFYRSYDVEMTWLYFDPFTTDRTCVDLSSVGGGFSVPVRGHQLCPLPKPTLDGSVWYAAINNAFPNPPYTVLPLKPSQLLYPYSNHENIFKCAASPTQF